MKRNMVRSTQQNGKSIPRRILGKILLRNRRVPLEPVSRGKAFEPCKQFTVDLLPEAPDFFARRSVWHGAIGIRQERAIQFRIQTRTQIQQGAVATICTVEPPITVTVACWASPDAFSGRGAAAAGPVRGAEAGGGGDTG